MYINNKSLTKENFLNGLIFLIPLSLIIGNPAVNLNIILVCLMGLLIYGFRLFKVKKDIVVYLLD